MSESVNGPTNGQTHRRRLESHPISSPRAFGSGELKKHVIILSYTYACKRANEISIS